MILSDLNKINLEQERFFSLKEIAGKLHISVGTARNRISRGEAMPPSIKIGRRHIYLESEFLAWLEKFRYEADSIKQGEF